MIEPKLEKLKKRYGEIEKLLSEPAVISRPDEYRRYTVEHSSLSEIMAQYNEYIRVGNELNGLKDLHGSDDPEMRSLAQSEQSKLTLRKDELYKALELALIPPDPNDGKNVIMEIRAGTGGDEAALFAGELYRMYCRFAEARHWKIELLDGHSTGLGGFKEVILMVSGKDVWKNFKFERGVHRVQRVPVTEASGRIHTSAVSVAVLPEAEDVDVEVKPEDLRIDTYRSSGAGGQHVNKTDSAVRITHIPTNIVVACQDERSQMKNRAKAMVILRAKLLEQRQIEQEKKITDDRRKQVGSGDRSEKVRTYNYPQNRLTDHRIDISIYRLKEILEGDMNDLVSKLIQAEQQLKLQEMGK